MTIDEQCKTSVLYLKYDPRAGVGQLFMEDGCCCDMDGCIALFKRIDPKVSNIITYSGDKTDTIYTFADEKWFAH